VTTAVVRDKLNKCNIW